MASNVSYYLLVILLHVCSSTIHGNTFDVSQSPRSTNVTLVEGDNVFISFVVHNPVEMFIYKKITKHFANGDEDDPGRFTHFVPRQDVTLRLNETALAGNFSAHWSTMGPDGVQHEEYIMRIAHGSQLADVVRLNIQFQIVDANIDAMLLPRTITFNIIMASATADSSGVTSTNVAIQPTAISNSRSPTSTALITPTPSQIPDRCPSCDSSLTTTDSETTSTIATLDIMSNPALSHPTSSSSQPNPSPSVTTPTSASTVFQSTVLSQWSTAGLSASGIVIIVLIAIIMVLAILLCVQCQKNNAVTPMTEQLPTGTCTPETKSSESNTSSLGITPTVFSNINGDLWDGDNDSQEKGEDANND